MTNDDFNHFVCIVAGNNPTQLMAQYDMSKGGEKRVLLPITQAPLLRKSYIDFYENLLKQKDLSKKDKAYAEASLESVKSDTDIEFFRKKGEREGLSFDPETGDIITFENKDGKWRSFELGHVFSVPFTLKDGTEAYTAKKGEIDWGKMNSHDKEIYEIAWETVMEGRTPENEVEENIYNNMKNRTFYFQKYGDKENYVASNSCFWGYAFLSEILGWKELEPEMDQFVWVKNFYPQFIMTLPDDTQLTIYECTK